MSEQRAFEGIWIPKELWLHAELSITEKVLVAEIKSLDQGEGCYASNDYLAAFMGVSVGRIKNIISDLCSRGFVESFGFDGRRRRLRQTVYNVTAAVTKTLPLTKTLPQPSRKRDTSSSIGENKVEGIDTNPPSSHPDEPDAGTRETSLFGQNELDCGRSQRVGADGPRQSNAATSPNGAGRHEVPGLPNLNPVDAPSSMGLTQAANRHTTVRRSSDSLPTDPRHHAITSAWSDRYRAAFDQSYAFNGRDAATLKRFLAGCKDSADEILGTAEAAWKRAKVDRFASRSKMAGTLHGLCTAYNDIRLELKTPATPENNGNSRFAKSNPRTCESTEQSLDGYRRLDEQMAAGRVRH